MMTSTLALLFTTAMIRMTEGSVTLFISSLLLRAPPLVLRAPSTCSASRLWSPLVLRARRYNPHNLRHSNLWSQTFIIPAANPAPQTTYTIVTRALGNGFISITNNCSASCMWAPPLVSELAPPPDSNTGGVWCAEL
ncbi:uncharacterized protein DS421_16g544290 [Arachis hypogaea]|nr:uncharacterized protein DS421_16g544290 [Arachis hypogaea]